MFDQKIRGKLENSKIRIWRLEMSQFTCDLCHKPGVEILHQMSCHVFAHHFIRQQNFVSFMIHWDTRAFLGSTILLKTEISRSLVKTQRRFASVVVRMLR